MLGCTILPNTATNENTRVRIPTSSTTSSNPWILALKLILLPFYLLVWAWLSAMLLLVLDKEGEEVARYVFGDAGVCVQAVVAPGVLGALMTGFT